MEVRKINGGREEIYDILPGLSNARRFYDCGCSAYADAGDYIAGIRNWQWTYCQACKEKAEEEKKMMTKEERGFDNITLLICENDRHSLGRAWMQNVVNSVVDVTTLSQEDLRYYHAAIYVLSQPCDHTGRMWEIS